MAKCVVVSECKSNDSVISPAGSCVLAGKSICLGDAHMGLWDPVSLAVLALRVIFFRTGLLVDGEHSGVG